MIDLRFDAEQEIENIPVSKYSHFKTEVYQKSSRLAHAVIAQAKARLLKIKAHGK